ncbi:type II toxin-antitoxin system VapC family toxin [Candidatus Woesearchaeota archaeon]|nr:type II toxin-antitoxin system VapC family toxin [Candidatus Woesearchaeota archaeon]
MLYCLDTNIVINFFRKDINTLEKMKDLEEKQVTVVINPVVLCELFRGVHLAEEQKNASELVEKFLKSVGAIEFTEQAARTYGKIYAELKKAGKQTQEFDLMIASICIAHNAVLVTRNKKDFVHIKDLKYVVW